MGRTVRWCSSARKAERLVASRRERLRCCLGRPEYCFPSVVPAVVRDQSMRNGGPCLHSCVLGDQNVGRRVAFGYLGGHQRAGDGCQPSFDSESFAARNGTDVARSSQRRRRTGPSLLAGSVESATSCPKCAFAMVMAARRACLDPWGRASWMVSADFCADASVVFGRDATSYAKSVTPGAAAGGFPGVRCVVGKIQRFQVTKIQGDTLQVKNP